MPATSVRCSVPTSIDSFISLREFGTFSAGEHLGDAQIDLEEVVDRDAVVGRGGAAASRAPPAAGARRGGLLSARLLLIGHAPICACPCLRRVCGVPAGRSGLRCVASMRGHRVSPFCDRPLAVVPPRGVRRGGCDPAGVVSPTRRRISAADFGMIGSSRMPATRTASATSNSTWLRRAAFFSSRASAHGSVSAMYSLAASTMRNAAAARPRARSDPSRRDSRAARCAATSGETARRFRRRDPPAAVLLGHRGDAAHQVAEVVRQVDVVALLAAASRRSRRRRRR